MGTHTKRNSRAEKNRTISPECSWNFWQKAISKIVCSSNEVKAGLDLPNKYLVQSSLKASHAENQREQWRIEKSD